MFPEFVFVQQQACQTGQCPTIQLPQITVTAPPVPVFAPQPLPLPTVQAVPVQVPVRKGLRLFGGCGLFGGLFGGCR